ncbi:aminotransferase class III-fold pyridoxal phosphate-dependent enzyme [Streptomyces asoensis]|uniref:aminotransferase class III-fold pyridoxal phosphate-dependent enzyme n=1 Tax=Streptomyces asoensis TaxID=249586 RepID=UPI0033F47EDF
MTAERATGPAGRSTVMHVRCPDRLPEETYRQVLEQMAELSPAVQALPPTAALVELKGALRYHRADAAQLGEMLRVRALSRLGVDLRIGVGPTITIATTASARIRPPGPGEHNGTFRGCNPAFVTATRALEVFWSDGTLEARTEVLGERVRRALTDTARRHRLAAPRGRGLVWGLPLKRPGAARAVCDAAYRAGLLLETAGLRDEVVKLLPPLTVTEGQLERGLSVLDESVAAVVGVRNPAA